MKKYFETKYSENCHSIDYFYDMMRLEELSEMEVFEAKIEYKTGFFWCNKFWELGEVGEGCGKICKEYKPRNGKNGRCVHSGPVYECGKKVKIKLKIC